MGGTGSGEKWYKKRKVEACRSLDTTRLKRWGLLAPGLKDHVGVFEWGREPNKASVGYVLTVRETDGDLRLLYAVQAPDEQLGYTIRLVTTPCRFGGVRWWFRCPLSRNGVACGRRVRKLYMRRRYFGCRQCHNLTYRSTQESDARVYALLRDGLHLMGDPARMSVQQLGLALQAFTLEERRLGKASTK